MKARSLSAICKIANRISNPSSLTSLYRSLELGPETIRCCSEFGNIEIYTESTGLSDKVLLDCSAVMAIAKTLPSDGEIVFNQQPARVDWSCDSAKGHLNLVQTDYAVPKITHDNFPWAPPPDLGNALLLASCACQAAAVSFGLYGVSIEPSEDKLHFMSCNSISLASSVVDLGTYPGKKVSIRPPVPGIIAALLSASANSAMDVTEDGIFINGDGLMAHLPLGTKLDHDLKEMSQKFKTGKEVAKINSGAVKKFIARARDLTDKKAAFNIALKVEQGKLILAHSGISSSTEQWMLAEGLDPKIKYESRSFPADMLLLPLEYISDVVLDYIPEQQLVLKGSNPEFLYVVGGT